MALARREFTVVDEQGNIVTDAQVEVRQEVAGQPLAAIYSDRDGTTPLGNPFSVDAETAVAAFHVAGGAYRIRAFKTGFERIERYVGIGTGSETDAGLIPTSISTGWAFDASTTDADPGSGLFRLNHATPASATEIYIDIENDGGNDVSAWLDSLDDGGDTATRGHLHICDPEQPTEIFHVYGVSGSVVDGTGYRKLTVAHVAGAGSLTADTLYSLTFSAKGDEGEVPATRTLTAGAGLTGGGTLASDRTFTVGAGTGIVANADDVAVDKASDANVRANTSDKVLTADLLSSAAGVVTLIDAATIEIDWASGINFDVTLTTNRILGNPTNEVAGQWRTVLVKSDGGPDTLTFGDEYGGEVPTIDDVTTSQFYLLMIYCKAAGQFLVTAIDGSDA